MPTNETLNKYYSNYYNTPDSKSSGEQVTFEEPLRLAKNLADVYRNHQDNDAVTILDFGGGDGTISYLLAEQLISSGVQQVNITLVELNERVVKSQDDRITINKVNSISDVSHRYKFVIASAVIEHYTQPKVLLENLLKCLEPGGIFYARTPYMVPIMKLFKYFGIKIDFTFPGHVHDLGQSFWEGYFNNEEKSQFKIIASRPSIVETTLSGNYLRTIAAYIFKAPWYVFGKLYTYVGGWEIFIQLETNKSSLNEIDDLITK